MALLTISSDLYRRIFTETLVHYLDLGLDLPAAKDMAQTVMANAFCEDVVKSIEEDAKDQAEGDIFR